MEESRSISRAPGYYHLVLVTFITIIIIIIKWVVGTKCFVTVRFDITGFFSSEFEFFEYVCSNRLE